MSANNIKLELNPRKDANGKKFYVAKLEGPYLIDCREGAAFLVFIAEEGAEELQIAAVKKGSDKSDKQKEE